MTRSSQDTVFPVEVAGIELDQTGFLWLLCSAFLLLVIVNQGFKYIINLYAGITGEDVAAPGSTFCADAALSVTAVS